MYSCFKGLMALEAITKKRREDNKQKTEFSFMRYFHFLASEERNIRVTKTY